jgi:superfamily II DNA or RNA helicase
MVEIHVKKQEIQEDIQRVIVSNNYKGLISAATGAGKTKVGVDLCEHVKKVFCKNKSFKTLISVPTTKLRDNRWPDEFKKWDKDSLLKNVSMSCYKSINKIKGEHFDLVILDEAHHITELNSEFFKQNKVDRVLGLTATPPRDLNKLRILDAYCPTIYDYPLEKAVTDGVVSPFSLKLVYYDLDNVTKNIEAGNSKKRFFQTEKAQYTWKSRVISEAIDSGKSTKMPSLARMRFLQNLPSKTKVAKAILKTIHKDKRFLVFGGSINQIEELCEHTYHSKSNNEDYDKFVKGEVNKLGCVQALNEGEDLPNIDGCLIVAFNSNPLSMIQRIGRIIRYRKKHLGEVIILCSKDTVEEEWLSKALDSICCPEIEEYAYRRNQKTETLIKI